MTEQVPRRMLRFYRNRPTAEEARSKSSEIAIKEVDAFKERHNRYPQKNELEEISQNVFDQLKRELEKTDAEAEEIYLGGLEATEKKGQKSGGRNLADERKAKKDASRKAEEKKKSETEKRDKKRGKFVAATDEPEEAMASEEPEILQFSEPEKSSDGIDEFEAEIKMKKEGVKNLAEMDELSKLESELSGEDEGKGEFDLVEKEIDTDLNVCPKCNNRASEIIYCPECGDAFCDHCAKNVEVLPDAVKYTCGKCGAQFRKRKSRIQ